MCSLVFSSHLASAKKVLREEEKRPEKKVEVGERERLTGEKSGRYWVTIPAKA